MRAVIVMIGMLLGVVVGGMVGVLLGLGLLAVPGVGPVAAAGTFAATLFFMVAGAISRGFLGLVISLPILLVLSDGGKLRR
jgi:hypothetical protein